ncbi:MAG: cytochrome c biogenesis protein CcsA [Flavobacteriales bacterium]
MNEINYLNEHPWPGIVGNFFVVLSFAASLFAAAAYFFYTRDEQQSSLRKAARLGFFIHGMAVFGTIGTMLFILFNHLYEYKYAWDHLNNAMPMKYVFSCMWEGQEGSFLLWTFWHVVLGFILIGRSGHWEPRVMAVISMVQVFLSSMLLGIYFGEFQFGSNPFLLNREVPSNLGLPWTQNPDYLSLPVFQDGKGLNPLLQNYWMTIHPPTLFLGFASTVVPFAFAIAGLWKRDDRSWMRPAIPWAFFGVMILGTGILMGGAWAYEALGFGGFWAWDPVENASLVPWLTLVGAAHLLVINQRKPTSLFATLLLTLSTFILILYSTFLTRSGVLGDSSVHSFVDSGILAQLLVYLLFFTALSTALMSKERRLRLVYSVACAVLFAVAVAHLNTPEETPAAEASELLPGEGTWIPGLTLLFLLTSLVVLIRVYRREYSVDKAEEENLWSREFWMFIGALVLTVMAIHVTVVTSVNVGNIFLTPFEGFFGWVQEKTNWEFAGRLAEHQFSAPADQERFEVYHRIQVPLAVILFFIIAFGQFLKYRDTSLSEVIRRIAIPFVLAFATVVLLMVFTGFGQESVPVNMLILATFFALFANAKYGWRVLRGKLDLMGASVAHAGFALLIIGAVVSTSQSYFISENKIGNIQDLSEEFSNKEDIMLLQGDTLAMGDYFVSYKEKYKSGERLYVTTDYFSQLPITYAEGDYVSMQGMVFRCMEQHVSSGDFLQDWSVDSLWSVVPMPSHIIEEKAKPWQPGQPGEKLFTLEPSILMSPKGNSREPSIEHSIGQDLYTFVKYTETEVQKTDESGYLEPKSGLVALGQRVRLTEVVDFRLDSLVEVDTIPAGLPEGVRARRGFVTLTDGRHSERLVLAAVNLSDSVALPFPVESKEFNMLLSLSDKQGKLELTVQQHSSARRDMLILTAQVFPAINVLWLGCIVMIIGTTMAIRHRWKLSRKG